MKIAIPIANGQLSAHFGHCESFTLIDVNPETKEINGQTTIPAPPHQPGLLPPWLAEKGATVIIAGGMGQRAQALFQRQGIDVVVGAPAAPPEKIVTDYLAGCLAQGTNLCDH